MSWLSRKGANRKGDHVMARSSKDLHLNYCMKNCTKTPRVVRLAQLAHLQNIKSYDCYFILHLFKVSIIFPFLCNMDNEQA